MKALAHLVPPAAIAGLPLSQHELRYFGHIAHPVAATLVVAKRGKSDSALSRLIALR